MEQKMKDLIALLNDASDAYYNSGEAIMTDKEFDDYMDTLVAMEKETGIVLPNSPTQRVGAEIDETSDRKKVQHEFPAKSLDKTKEREELVEWLNGKEGCISWKMDGQTVQATYENGKLVLAATRGNGEIGVEITDVVPYIKGLPTEIPFQGKLVVRGESVMSYPEFERINASLGAEEEKYKNPRNLAVGTMTALSHEVHATRQLEFFAFRMVYCDYAGEDFKNIPSLYSDTLAFLGLQGFQIVPQTVVTPETVVEVVGNYEKVLEAKTENDFLNFPFPTDGLVITFQDVAYGESLGSTGKFPRHSKAFKWADECVESKLLSVEWSPSRSGLLNPVAVFEPVEIEGTMVSRASIFNLSTFEQLRPGFGDRVMIYKANMIIPQISKNLDKTGTFKAPDVCPVCGAPTQVKITTKKDVEVKTIYCSNPDCSCKILGKLEHFVKRNAMNMEGVSTQTIKCLNEKGWLNEFADFYTLKDHAEEIMNLDGMGEVAVKNLLNAVEKSRNVAMKNFIYALSIPFVGTDTSKYIAKYVDTVEKFKEVLEYPDVLIYIDSIGPAVISSIRDWWESPIHKEELNRLLSYLTFVESKRAEEQNFPPALIHFNDIGNVAFPSLRDYFTFAESKKAGEQKLQGLVFVITGSVNHFDNRDALKAFIEENGGTTSGSVSKNTSYLINNDVTSTSGKNKKAKELNVPILSEEDFLKLMQ